MPHADDLIRQGMWPAGIDKTVAGAKGSALTRDRGKDKMVPKASAATPKMTAIQYCQRPLVGPA